MGSDLYDLISDLIFICPLISISITVAVSSYFLLDLKGIFQFLFCSVSLHGLEFLINHIPSLDSLSPGLSRLILSWSSCYLAGRSLQSLVSSFSSPCLLDMHVPLSSVLARPVSHFI